MQLTKAQQQVVEENTALVRQVIKDKVHGIGSIGAFTYDDLYQIGCIGLCKAAYTDKYQNAHNKENAFTEGTMRFSTYAYRLIWNEICTALAYATKVRSEHAIDPGDMAGAYMVGHIALDDGIADAELRSSLDNILHAAAASTSGVTTKGIQALQYMAQGYTSTEIAAIMGGTSCHNVTAWISKARKHLKANPELLKLASHA